MNISIYEGVSYNETIKTKNNETSVKIGDVKLNNGDKIEFKITKDEITIIKNNTTHKIKNSKETVKDFINILKSNSSNYYRLAIEKIEKTEHRVYNNYDFVIEYYTDFMGNMSRDIFMKNTGEIINIELDPPYNEPEQAQGKKYFFWGSEYRISFAEKAERLIEQYEIEYRDFPEYSNIDEESIDISESDYNEIEKKVADEKRKYHKIKKITEIDNEFDLKDEKKDEIKEFNYNMNYGNIFGLNMDMNNNIQKESEKVINNNENNNNMNIGFYMDDSIQKESEKESIIMKIGIMRILLSIIAKI